MVEDGRGLCRTWSEVRSRKVVNRPALMAAHHVERAGENMSAWTKTIRSVIKLIDRTELAEQVGFQVVRRYKWLARRRGLGAGKQ
jgi:hypothetical protein